METELNINIEEPERHQQSCLVHIHGDLYVDAACVVSVEAYERDMDGCSGKHPKLPNGMAPIVEVIAWRQNVNAPLPAIGAEWSGHTFGRVYSFASMDEARQLASDIVKRVNSGRTVAQMRHPQEPSRPTHHVWQAAPDGDGECANCGIRVANGDRAERPCEPFPPGPSKWCGTPVEGVVAIAMGPLSTADQ